MNISNIRRLLLAAPESQLDDTPKKMIEKWAEPDPTALQVLEVLDYVVHFSAGGQLALIALEALLADRALAENTTYDDVVKQATWRADSLNPQFPSLQTIQ